MRTETVSEYRGGMWAWLFQRITAVLLVVMLAIHLVFTFILNIGELSYDNVANRLAHAGFVFVDIVLLASVLFHGLNGLRMVLMDYWFSSRKKAVALSIVLWIVGLAVMVYGTWALWPWITRGGA